MSILSMLMGRKATNSHPGGDGDDGSGDDDPFADLAAGPKRKRQDQDPNVRFYANQIESRPHGAFIDTIHAEWDGKFGMLEQHHGYIQWLFPVFENAGMNWESQALSKEGARQIRSDPQMSERVIRSYRLMLRFYGLRLADERTGAVERDPEDDGARIGNFNNSPHNFLRISRIITSLGELGFVRYKRPFLEALRVEVEAGRLRRARDSLQNFWSRLVDDEGSLWYERKTLEDAADREEGCLFAPGGRLSDAPAAAVAAAAAAAAPEAEASQASEYVDAPEHSEKDEPQAEGAAAGAQRASPSSSCSAL